MLWDDDEPLAELRAAEDAEELCRRLLASPWGWGSSTRHAEAIELLGNLQGTGELPMGFVALMLCTCRRWDRVTNRLIAAVEDSGLLDDAELDVLADSCLSHEHVISYPLVWASPQWLEVQLDGGNGRTYTVSEDTHAEHRPSFEPPLRRWAAQRALRSDPARLEDLLRAAELFEPRQRGALIHGLLDGAEILDEPHRRVLIGRGLKATQASVRRTALDRLCELDGPEKARRRASTDPNAAVRKWRPRASWYREDADVEAKLPLLSTFLGHVEPSSTYWYFEGAPQLLALALEPLERTWEEQSLECPRFRGHLRALGEVVRDLVEV